MISAEKEKQRSLEGKWRLSINRNSDSDLLATNVAEHFGSLKDFIRNSKELSLSNLEGKKAHSATKSKGVPSAT